MEELQLYYRTYERWPRSKQELLGDPIVKAFRSEQQTKNNGNTASKNEIEDDGLDSLLAAAAENVESAWSHESLDAIPISSSIVVEGGAVEANTSVEPLETKNSKDVVEYLKDLNKKVTAIETRITALENQTFPSLCKNASKSVTGGPIVNKSTDAAAAAIDEGDLVSKRNSTETKPPPSPAKSSKVKKIDLDKKSEAEISLQRLRKRPQPTNNVAQAVVKPMVRGETKEKKSKIVSGAGGGNGSNESNRRNDRGGYTSTVLSSPSTSNAASSSSASSISTSHGKFFLG